MKPYVTTSFVASCAIVIACTGPNPTPAPPGAPPGADPEWEAAFVVTGATVFDGESNIGQVDDQVIIAYEETKGAEGWEEGKYVRYHDFRFDAPPVSGPGKHAPSASASGTRTP